MAVPVGQPKLTHFAVTEVNEHELPRPNKLNVSDDQPMTMKLDSADNTISSKQTIESTPMLQSPTVNSLKHEHSSASLLSTGDDNQREKEREHIQGLLVNLLSGLYALILVILAFSFQVSTIVSDLNDVTKYQGFYIYLYTVGLLFFVYCQLFLLRSKGYTCCGTGVAIPVPFYSSLNRKSLKWMSRSTRITNGSFIIRQPKSVRSTKSGGDTPDTDSIVLRKRNVSHTAPSAGSMYLRFGAVVFGAASMIENGLTIVSRIEQKKCSHVVDIVANIVSIIFTFMQLYFIFMNSRLVICRFKNLGRFGTMHLVATHLCVWIRSIVMEEYHVIQEIAHSLQGPTKNHTSSEPHKQPQAHDAQRHRRSDNHGSAAESSSAAAAPHGDKNLLSWSGFIERNAGHGVDVCGSTAMEEMITSIRPFLTTCLIEYSIICAGVMFVLWWNIGGDHHGGHGPETGDRSAKQRRHAFRLDCSSSVKGLFAGLLFVVFSMCSMVMFFIKIQMEEAVDALWVFYVSDIIMYCLATGACLFTLYKIRSMKYMPLHESSQHVDNLLLVLGLFGQLVLCLFSMTGAQTHSVLSYISVMVSFLRGVQVLVQTIVILAAQRLVAALPAQQRDKPGRETITFLLLVNISLFLINAFELAKASAHPIMVDFYGKGPWNMIVHSTVPLCIFYRFHSSVCFAEIWKNTYRSK